MKRLPVFKPTAEPAPAFPPPPDIGDRPMTKVLAVQIAGALGHPSKMPGYSYGISAFKCQTGGELAKVAGSVCSGCYAKTDWYRSWRPLLAGHARRWAGLTHPRWVDALVFMIERACRPPDNYFRWHDSGDLQGVWHLANIAEVCRRTPGVQHWLPTREYRFVAHFLEGLPGVREPGVIPPNLTIRLSAHMIDQDPVFPPELASLLAGLPVSTVSSVPLTPIGMQVVEGKGSIECQAVAARENKCGNCRACWDRRVISVNYPQH